MSVTATPAPWHIAVQPSEVDPHEEEHPTGLIVKHDHDHSDTCEHKLKRGVVMALGAKVNETWEGGYDFEVGDVIFYHRGDRLRGLDYVYPSFDNLVAFEKN